MTPALGLILPTRVRRNYAGGALLDAREGAAQPRDGNRPEDWLASTVRAVNPGMEEVPGEGLTRVLAGGREWGLPDWVAHDPEWVLGAAHLARTGRELGFLAKLLDSAMRLHVQAHPTAAFARQHLNSRYGKLETYVILAARPGVQPYLRLGFQRAPSRAEWRRIIAKQDIAAMDACFDRIPVRAGEVWVVPGGMPHAIGEGVLMLEVMEPTDLVVRCEFEREGIVVPPAARFMGRDLDFCLQVFDYDSRSPDDIRRACCVEPVRREAAATHTVHELVGSSRTSCFGIARVAVAAGATAVLPGDGRVRVCLAEDASLVCGAGAEQLPLPRLSAALVAAGAGVLRVRNPGPGVAAALVVTAG